MKIFFFIFILSFLFSNENIFLDRIEKHIILKDYDSAINESKKALKKNKKSNSLKRIYIKSLAKKGNEKEALFHLNKFSNIKKEKDSLEEISWSILKKGFLSSQYATKISSLIGIYFLKDSESVYYLNKALKDSNAIIRSVALQLASSFKDDILIKTIEDLSINEKVWFVRLEIIKAIGKMKIKSRKEFLKNILKNGKVTFEEKMLAISSLLEIYDEINIEDLKMLLNSKYTNFCYLGCMVASLYEVDDVKNDILNLLKHERYDVKIASLLAISNYYKKIIDSEILKKEIEKCYDNLNPLVSITASWVGLQLNYEEAKKNMEKWIFDKYPENRRYAAASIAQTGAYGLALAKRLIDKSKDPYVKINLALGLIGQREDIKKSKDIIFNFINDKKDKLMFDGSCHPYISILSPSRITYSDQFPNYCEAVDQSTTLRLLSLLTILEDKRANSSIKKFLKEKIWGISGIASMTLLQSGDKESFKILKKLLLDKDKNIQVQAALSLAMVAKDETVLPILEKAYVEANYKIKLILLEAMGNVGNESSLAFLVKALNEPFFNLKIAAASSIIQIINY